MPKMGYHWTPCNGNGKGISVITVFVIGIIVGIVVWVYRHETEITHAFNELLFIIACIIMGIISIAVTVMIIQVARMVNRSRSQTIQEMSPVKVIKVESVKTEIPSIENNRPDMYISEDMAKELIRIYNERNGK